MKTTLGSAVSFRDEDGNERFALAVARYDDAVPDAPLNTAAAVGLAVVLSDGKVADRANVPPATWSEGAAWQPEMHVADPGAVGSPAAYADRDAIVLALGKDGKADLLVFDSEASAVEVVPGVAAGDWSAVGAEVEAA